MNRRNTMHRYATVVAIAAVVVVSLAITVLVIKNRNKVRKAADNDTSASQVTTQITTQEETTAQSEEDTQETEVETTPIEIVQDYVVEGFFENEISTEDQEALELPPRQLTSEFIPYDGVKRNISYYGDSMVAGAGCAGEAYANGMDITGWTSPRTIQYFTHINTYNMGVSGENSYQIAFRAGGIGVYIDRDITISESQTALARLIDDNGDVFTSSDYSGYGWDTNPDAGTMYINGYLCDVENADDDMVSIKLTKGYAAYSGSAEPKQTAKNIAFLTEKETEGKEGDTSEVPTETQTEPSTEVPTETQTETPTEMPSEIPTIGNVDIPEGTRAVTKAANDRSAKDILILEIGSNGGWGDNYQQLILQYDSIILNAGCKYYIIVGDTDDPGTSADIHQGEYNEDGSYVGIGDTAWEAALREAYGDHFFNTRTYMIQHGLDDCGLKTTTQDLDDYLRGNISKQLRYDWTHFNAYGYYSKGKGIYQKGVELGYWS